MKRKLYILLIFLSISSQYFAQNINGYKYVIIPKKFDFQKSADQFQLNSLTKFLFEKEGFKVLFDDENFPQDLRENSCLGLKTNIISNSNMLATKLTLQLLNCDSKEIFTSEEGVSRIKDFKRGYHDAVRKAFQSVKDVGYSFDKKLVITKIKKDFNNQQEEVLEEKKETVARKIKDVEISKVENKTETVVENIQNNAKTEKVVTKAAEENIKDVSVVVIEDNAENVLYAQNILNGFQLVDSTPKIVFKALKSMKENVYYLENKAGILYQKDNEWFAEYYKGATIITEKLTIKF